VKKLAMKAIGVIIAPNYVYVKMVHCAILKMEHALGYIGEKCEMRCPEGTFGQGCKYQCLCQNNGTCDPVTGQCACPPGFEGLYCENECQRGFYGLNCQEECLCNITTSEECDFVSGLCTCLPGWKGDFCEETCDNHTWGTECGNPCPCASDVSCNHITGKCLCEPGYQGYNCLK
ncbi:hypothetical protein TNIN_480371, partial [Trichonephila inaurata madagascariensis]